MALDQFALARQRAQQGANESTQRQKDALQRRFASLGNLDSGVAMKMEQQAETESRRQLDDVNAGIDAAEQAESARKQEVKEGRDFSRSERLGSQEFASGERLGSQGFASGEALKGRQFSTAERLGSQGFAAGEALKGRQYSTSERVAGQKYASGEAKAGRDFSAAERRAGQNFNHSERIGSQQFSQFERGRDRDVATDQFDRTLEEEKFVNRSNIAQNAQQANENSKGSWLDNMMKDPGKMFQNPGVSWAKETTDRWSF